MAIKRFGDVAIDPENVICVSRKIARHDGTESDEDGTCKTNETEDRSSMLLKIDGTVIPVDISEHAADDLLDHFARQNPNPKPKEE